MLFSLLQFIKTRHHFFIRNSVLNQNLINKTSHIYCERILSKRSITQCNILQNKKQRCLLFQRKKQIMSICM